MKSRLGFFAILFTFLFIFTSVSYSQSVPVYKMIGKSAKTVTNTYGNPAHRDKSDPLLECMFYQTKNLRMVFVSGKDGVFQAESTRLLNSSNSAKSHLDDILKGCIEAGMEVDTLNPDDYKASSMDARAEITLFKNTYSQKYEVRVKATK